MHSLTVHLLYGTSTLNIIHTKHIYTHNSLSAHQTQSHHTISLNLSCIHSLTVHLLYGTSTWNIIHAKHNYIHTCDRFVSLLQALSYSTSFVRHKHFELRNIKRNHTYDLFVPLLHTLSHGTSFVRHKHFTYNSLSTHQTQSHHTISLNLSCIHSLTVHLFYGTSTLNIIHTKHNYIHTCDLFVALLHAFLAGLQLCHYALVSYTQAGCALTHYALLCLQACAKSYTQACIYHTQMEWHNCAVLSRITPSSACRPAQGDTHTSMHASHGWSDTTMLCIPHIAPSSALDLNKITHTHTSMRISHTDGVTQLCCAFTHHALLCLQACVKSYTQACVYHTQMEWHNCAVHSSHRSLLCFKPEQNHTHAHKHAYITHGWSDTTVLCISHMSSLLCLSLYVITPTQAYV